MSTEFGLRSRDSEWNASFGSQVELFQSKRRSCTKRSRCITICIISVLVALSFVIGLTIGMMRRRKAETPSSTPISDWISKPCSNTQSAPKCAWNSGNSLLLMSMSGFRADYLNRNITPVINKLRQCGVQTPYLRPVYPTRSIPNLYTIVTGLYPESHGIVNNQMFDRDKKATFETTQSDPDWWLGEPIWVTAKKNGKIAASCNWPGSDVIFDGQPDLQCNSEESKEEMVDTIIQWLMLENGQRPDFMSVSFREPGKQGQLTGPKSAEVDSMIQNMDGIIGKLMDSIFANGIENCVNVMIVSDHGMSDISCSRQLSLDYYLENRPQMKNLLTFGGAVGNIYMYTNYTQQNNTIFENKGVFTKDDIITELECRSSHMKVFTHETIPIRHHYGSNNRIGDVILDVADEWLALTDRATTCPKGGYGYDDVYDSMHGIFLGYGPDFKRSIPTEPFESIELYNIMSELISVTPASNNGTVETLSHILRNSSKETKVQNGIAIQVCNGSSNRQSSCICDFKGSVSNPPDHINEMTFPFGVPVFEGNVDACLLYGQQFSIIYSTDNKQPSIASFLLESHQAQNYKSIVNSCIRPDKRLTYSVNPDCKAYSNSDENINAVHLFDPGFSTTEDKIAESYLSSTVVPMYAEFQMGIWNFLWSLIRDYAVSYGNLHISVGPIFNRNHNDHKEYQPRYVQNSTGVPIPTHFYVILVKCSEKQQHLKDCRTENLDILSFALPHVRKQSNCLSDEDYLKDNMVRIRDIELLTGLRLLTKFESNAGARKRTFLPSNIWPSPLFAHWIDLPCDEENACVSEYTPLLLISMDGFKADYLSRNLTHTFEKLRTCGVRTPYLRSVYPTETYPNHYTIVTGLYPESHGIVGNYMYDVKMNALFDEDTEGNPNWWKGEPLWVTVKQQGKKSASIYWFGSEVNDISRQPSYNRDPDESYRMTDGVDQAISWMLMDKDKRPDFITFYIWQPDDLGHRFGPDSVEMNEMLQHLEKLLQYLMDKLLLNNLHNCVNLMIVSDHGMAEESCQRQIALKHYFPEIDDVLAFIGTNGMIDTAYRLQNSTVVQNDKCFNEQNLLQALKCKSEHFDAFTKETLPVRYHYTNNERIGNLVVDAHDTWILTKEERDKCSQGNHGYDPLYKSMQALFIGHGPAFKQNFEAEPFENIELYNLMSEIVGVKPVSNNGTRGALNHILRKHSRDIDQTVFTEIRPCAGMYNRTSTCSCNDSISLIPPGDIKYPGGLAHIEEKLSICSLNNSLFTTIFSNVYKQPVLLHFSIKSEQVDTNTVKSLNCTVPDVKLSEEENPDCSAYENIDMDITYVPLFSADFKINVNQFGKGEKRRHGLMKTTESADVHRLSSSLVPMYSGFYTGIWSSLLSSISAFLRQHRTVHVTSGPVFDRNYDGRVDDEAVQQVFVKVGSKVAVPTHYYTVLMRCTNETVKHVSECDVADIDVLSFVLPHVSSTPNCKTIMDYLKQNVVRLRDIELLTGFRFFMEAEWTQAARIRTYLPTELWSMD